MPRLAYVNGSYVPHIRAAVHVEDRGYQFGDGVYEVICVRDGRQVEADRHWQRLDHSLGALSIDWPMSRRALEFIVAQLIRMNGLRHGFVYLQITRGVAPRDHAVPDPAPHPSLVLTTKRTKPFDPMQAERGVAVRLVPDQRWTRRDIKSIGLLPNVLAKQEAMAEGAFDAWMVDGEGNITEGTASNAWIVTGEGVLITRQATHSILNGITRLGVLDVARALGIGFEERAFSVAEARLAKEAFLTSSTNWLRPVIRIDDKAVADGQPGPLTQKLLERYMEVFGVDG
ncbi:D-amino-acid transaminase [Magnetospira sp. QH-2]|uniref:D-amino-acid transaminase n=1 Tax=Magnetospira sp. (strain QH-2) TaxID=1288970 RepID=UPI0003E80A4A|nr:D-amino-acid transaminase [Magnetospira sp. QH-2]CCQ73799.1 D-alanine aminotransferase [Magnetospira sp. QH-2]